MKNPCFDNLLKVLNKQRPDRPVNFEFFLNEPLYEELAGFKHDPSLNLNCDYKLLIAAFKKAGYDYTSVVGSEFFMHRKAPHTRKKSMSLNEHAAFYDRETYDEYKWDNPEDYDYSLLKKCEEVLPDGMKLVVWGPNGVLENVTALCGYDNLCYMLADDEDLVGEIFNQVGSRLLTYYEICLEYDSVGAIISNDDWGFKTQTMFSPEVLRKYVFPWQKKFVEAAHKKNRPVILHSCGRLDDVYDDIINDMKFDAKHSYEDNIQPVEEAYDKLCGKIAVLGGIDLDFVCRSTPAEIEKRSRKMLEKGMEKGGYALGTGNSIPDYVPRENYFAMINVVNNW